jgi:hypothetical protein
MQKDSDEMELLHIAGILPAGVGGRKSVWERETGTVWGCVGVGVSLASCLPG